MRRFLTIVCLSFGSVAWGQVSTPLLGYLPDRGGIRPVNGIPAAAAIAPALEIKQNSVQLSFATIVASPAHDYAIVTADKLGTVSIYTPAHGLTALMGATSSPRLVVTSPRGSAAVLWSSPSNHAQLVTGLPDAPVIRQINASFLRGAPRSLAISDDGKWLAGTWLSGLYLWGQYGEVTQLPMQENAVALAFFQGRPDLAVAVPHGVMTFKAADGFNVSSLLYDSGDWQPDVTGLAVSPDNASIILADRTGWIVSIDAASGTAAKIDCGCQPEGLFGMGQSAFRLTGVSNGAIRLFDSAHQEVLFAPVAVDEGVKP